MMFIYLNYIFIPIPAEVHKNCLFAIGTIVFMITSPENSLSDKSSGQNSLYNGNLTTQPENSQDRACSKHRESPGTEHYG